MTKHYELFDSVPAKIFCGFALHLCLQLCVNMADPTQLFGVDGGV
jgi:hypothetical protein